MLKYNFESNSQPISKTASTATVGNYMLKYNFESNSQLNNRYFGLKSSWELYAKVQF